MHAPVERSLSKTAVGTRDDVLAADQLSDPYDSLADEFGMPTLVAWLITPGISTLPGGSLTSRLKSHS